MRHIESIWLPAAALLALAPTVSEGQAQPVIIQGEGLEEILVTARKRDEALIDVPVAINVFNDEQIRSAGIRRPRHASPRGRFFGNRENTGIVDMRLVVEFTQ